MTLRLCSYNVEHFNRLFTDANALDQGPAAQARVAALRTVLTTIDPDVLGVVEAPDTSASSGRDTVACLEAFAAAAGLRAARALAGYRSAGAQEIAFLFDPGAVQLVHDPGGAPGTVDNPPFDQEFHIDTDQDGILEIYRHYRPPLEARLTPVAGNQAVWLMVVHTKSKGIFDRMDWVHWERESERNRRKLFAECLSIRRRADEWLAQGRDVVVMGDVNDGPGMDGHEARFGRSAVELIMGDLFAPRRILTSLGGPPRWREFGWEPSSARFTDQFTGDLVNVLIDHILVSPGIRPAGADAHRVWNPFQLAAAQPIRQALLDASDHFPVSLDIDVS